MKSGKLIGLVLITSLVAIIVGGYFVFNKNVEVEALYRKNQIPWINSTNYSVEEIATKILDIMGLSRRMY